MFALLVVISTAMPVLAANADSVSEATRLPAMFTDVPSQHQIDIMKKNGNDIFESKTNADTASLSTRALIPFHKGRSVISPMKFNTCMLNNRYNFIGQASAYNATPASGTLAYQQSISKTTNWNVSSTLSAEGKLKVLF